MPNADEQIIAQILGIDPAWVEANARINDSMTWDVVIPAGPAGGPPWRYRVKVTGLEVAANGSNAIRSACWAVLGRMVVDGTAHMVRVPDHSAKTALEMILSVARRTTVGGELYADGMDEVLDAFGRLIEARSGGKTAQIQTELEHLAGIVLAWALALNKPGA